jgi:hypothetical protein
LVGNFVECFLGNAGFYENGEGLSVRIDTSRSDVGTREDCREWVTN